jgi:hypothetical protein
MEQSHRRVKTKVRRSILTYKVILAEAAGLEPACAEATAGFQPAGPPIAHRLRMEEGSRIELPSRRSAGTQDRWRTFLPCPLSKRGGKGGSRTRTSRRTCLFQVLVSNEPPLGRISAYLSDGGPPRNRTEFHRFAAGALTVCLRSSKLAGDQRIELCNAGFGVRRSPNRACPPSLFQVLVPSGGAPGIRTQTERILSPSPLPIGLERRKKLVPEERFELSLFCS